MAHLVRIHRPPVDARGAAPLATVNDAAVNTVCRYPFETLPSTVLCISPEVGLLEPLSTVHTVSPVAAPCHVPSSRAPFLHILPNTRAFQVF